MAEDGADVIVLGSTTMHQSAAWLADNLPIPVINPGLVAYKQAELLVQLGLTHSKKAFPAPGVGNDAGIKKGQRLMAEWSEGAGGQTPLPYPYYIDIVTKRYFDGVDNKNMDAVLDCFTEDAILTEVTSATVHNGKPAIRCDVHQAVRRFFRDLARQFRAH